MKQFFVFVVAIALGVPSNCQENHQQEWDPKYNNIIMWWNKCYFKWFVCSDPNAVVPTLLNTDVIDASTRLLAFAHRLADNLLTERNEKSLVFSPLSIGDALLLLMLGARGETYAELTQLLGYQWWVKSATIHEDFERLHGTLMASNSNLNDPEVDHYVRVANALFIQSGISLRPDYKSTIQSIYQADTFNVDFRSPSVVHQVNKWVDESTHGKIQQILSKQLDEQTKMVMASTVYFNAKWKTTFFEDMTKPRPFWLDGREKPPVNVDMMALGGKFPFYDAPEYNCRMLALPYKNSTSTMFLLLPNNSSPAAVRDLHRKLNAEIINQMIANMTVASSIVFLPKMHLTSTIDLHRTIAGFGARSLFDPFRADLGLIADDVESLKPMVPNGGASYLGPNFNSNSNHDGKLEDVLIFSRFKEDPESHGDEDMKIRSKRNTYKTASSKSGPLRMKDFILRKRITKENKLDKKSHRHRRQVIDRLSSLKSLDRLRNSTIGNPGLFANEIVHKVDLVVNEKGTEGGAG